MRSGRKPTGSRKPGSGIAALRTRAGKARATNAGRIADDRAHRLLDAYLATAERQGRPAEETVSDMARGEAAWQIGMTLYSETLKTPPAIARDAACAAGCAFCCILDGGDGGTITEAEATRLHRALAPLTGGPDGRAWHPRACPALDPQTRACRAYDTRPLICRSFLSTDAAACRTNAEGGSATGAGVLGSHVDYLAVHALVRSALKGIARVSTYSLARVASGAVGGEELTPCLAAARHPKRVLEDACRDLARAGAASRSGLI